MTYYIQFPFVTDDWWYWWLWVVSLIFCLVISENTLNTESIYERKSNICHFDPLFHIMYIHEWAFIKRDFIRFAFLLLQLKNDCQLKVKVMPHVLIVQIRFNLIAYRIRQIYAISIWCISNISNSNIILCWRKFNTLSHSGTDKCLNIKYRIHTKYFPESIPFIVGAGKRSPVKIRQHIDKNVSAYSSSVK